MIGCLMHALSEGTGLRDVSLGGTTASHPATALLHSESRMLAVLLQCHGLL